LIRIAFAPEGRGTNQERWFEDPPFRDAIPLPFLLQNLTRYARGASPRNFLKTRLNWESD
jgi:hypothetical protein